MLRISKSIVRKGRKWRRERSKWIQRRTVSYLTVNLAGWTDQSLTWCGTSRSGHKNIFKFFRINADIVGIKQLLCNVHVETYTHVTSFSFRTANQVQNTRSNATRLPIDSFFIRNDQIIIASLLSEIYQRLCYTSYRFKTVRIYDQKKKTNTKKHDSMFWRDVKTQKPLVWLFSTCFKTRFWRQFQLLYYWFV